MYLTGIKDKEGRPVFWIRIQMFDKVSGRPLRESHKKYITYLMEKQDKITSHEGWVSVTDMSNATMVNIDIDFIYYFIKILETYYPRGPKRDIILELPKTSIINEAAQLVLSYMGKEMKEKTLFITTEELNKYFDDQNIPAYVKQKKS